MTIAHRINTIIENDKVVCLESGELVAKATPAELLRDKNSMFAKLVAETGEQSERNLRASAEECEAARAAGTCPFVAWGARATSRDARVLDWRETEESFLSGGGQSLHAARL